MKNLYLYKLRIIGIVLGAALFGFAGTVNAAVVNTSVADSKVEDFGAGVVVNYDVFSWTATTSPGVTAVTMQVRAGTTASPSSDSDPDWTSWTAISSGDTVGAPLDGKRYFQYRVTMTSEDINEVASLNDVQIGWSAYDTNPISLISSPYNSTNAQNFISALTWTSSTPAGTELKFQIRTAPDTGSSTPGVWSDWLGPTTSTDYYTYSSQTINTAHSDTANDQWMQYQVFLSTTNVAQTPVLYDVAITYVANATPEMLTIATSTQQSDGLVSISYSVRDTDSLENTNAGHPGYITPSFQYSLNNGASWEDIVIGLSAAATSTKAVNTVTTENYTEYSLTWNAKTQINGTTSTQAMIKVKVDDGELANRYAYATSTAFTLDVADPVWGAVPIYIDASSSPAIIHLAATDDSSLSMKFSTDPTGGNNWIDYSAVATSTLADPSTVYVQLMDSYSNTSTIKYKTTIETPTNFIIRDISNNETSDYRLFVSWKAVSVPLDEFAYYTLYYSTTGADGTWSAFPNVTSRGTNYYIEAPLASEDVRYYKVITVDDFGNISHFSSTVNDAADGQGGTDLTPPTITNVTTSSIDTESATITWDTDELSDSTVGYSTNVGVFVPTLGVRTMVNNPTGVGHHSVTLTDLTPATTYYFNVTSEDPSGNSATSSPDGNGYYFTTLNGPTISGISVKSVGNTIASITWNTNSAADSQIHYGTSTACTSTASDSTSVTEHTMNLTGLTAGTKYYFYVGSGVASNNNGGEYYNFTTTEDTVAPVITAVTSTIVIDTQTVITWLTNEGGTSQIFYGVSSTIYNYSTTIDTSYNINHTVALSSLTTSTKYYYVVVSTDASGNTSTSSPEKDFTTKQNLSEEDAVVLRETVAEAAGVVEGVASVVCGGGGGSSGPTIDTTPPTISNPKLASITTKSATLTWDTNEDGDSLAEFGKDDNYGQGAMNFKFSKTHQITLTGLSPLTTYNYRVTSADAAGNRVFSPSAFFTTLSELDEIANPIAGTQSQDNETVFIATIRKANELIKNMSSRVSVGVLESALLEQNSSLQELAKSLPIPLIGGQPVTEVGPNFARVSWTTDKSANSLVSFASGDAYILNKKYDQTVGDPLANTTEHTVEIKGLEPDTAYHYRVISRTPTGAEAQSPDFTFKTKQESTTIYNYKIDIINTEQAAFSWFTNLPVDSSISYTPYRDGVLASEYKQTIHDKNFTTFHTVKLSDLEAGVMYDVEISGIDYGNNTVSKVLKGFSTNKTDIPPVISQVQTDSAIIPGEKSNIQVIISWLTNELATGNVYYRKGFSAASDEFPDSTPVDTNYTKKHIAVVTNFEPGSIYQFQARSTDSAGNMAISKTYTILTPRKEESVFQVIVSNVEELFSWVGKLKK